MIFMYSSNGGNTVTYDYFLPDGYPDYWPDVAMTAGTVHFVNAEQDAETGEMEILIATDAYTGSFASPASFTGWTGSNGGYPRVACQETDVYVVYQLDYTDGIVSDGDIIYTYSSDSGSSLYGPYGLVADEYDSVGPSLFVRGGVVGCVWLDAPAGGDEFQLATRLASAGGAADFFGDVELITDAPRVEPVFHAADAVFTGSRAHAAWSDRRDYPTQGRNIYTSRRDLSRTWRPSRRPLGQLAGRQLDRRAAQGRLHCGRGHQLRQLRVPERRPARHHRQLPHRPARSTASRSPRGGWTAVCRRAPTCRWRTSRCRVRAAAHTVGVRLDPHGPGRRGQTKRTTPSSAPTRSCDGDPGAAVPADGAGHDHQPLPQARPTP